MLFLLNKLEYGEIDVRFGQRKPSPMMAECPVCDLGERADQRSP
jgi:hypothetical protein